MNDRDLESVDRDDDRLETGADPTGANVSVTEALEAVTGRAAVDRRF